MNLPYLANVYAAMNGPAPATTTPIGPGPAQPDYFGLANTPPPTVVAPPELGGPPPPPQPDPHADEANQMSVTGPTSTEGPMPPPPSPEPPPPPAGRPGGNEYPLLTIPGSGSMPAHEVERRGPSLLAAQGARNLASEETIGRVLDRNEQAAQTEYAVALDQERQARAREAAIQQSIAERDQEMAQRQADFDDTARQLGKMGTIDRDRFWASRSTGQKIAGFIEMALSGFTGTPSLIRKRIDDDIKAQEFAYYATRDTAQSKQTAFAQAMQKYGNADAARAMAKAAALDSIQAQFGQLSAKWKGTESANRADMAAAALQDEKMMQIAQGIQFVPAQRAGRRFIDPRTGLIYSESEAKALSAKVDERDFENRKQVAGIGGQLAVEDARSQNDLVKAQIAAQKDVRGQLVKLPNGDVVQAPTDKEADTLRGMSSAVSNAQQLVNEAIEIRSDPTWAVSGPKRDRLKQIGSELTLAFKDRGQLGALSGPDMELAQAATANLTGLRPGTSERLADFARVTNRALQNRVKTIPGAPDTAQGQLPPEAAADFKAYGKKK